MSQLNVPPFDPAPREEWGDYWPDPKPAQKPRSKQTSESDDLQPAHLYVPGSLAFIAGSLASLCHLPAPELLYMCGSLLFLAGSLVQLRK